MPDDRNEFVVLTTLRREFEAATIAEALHAHGVQTETTHVDAPAAIAHGRPVREHRVLVRAGDLRKAQELLKFIQAQSMHLSWAQAPSPAAPAAAKIPETPGTVRPPAEPSHVRSTEPTATRMTPDNPVRSEVPSGSRKVPLIVAIVVIALFVIVVLAIMGRPAGG